MSPIRGVLFDWDGTLARESAPASAVAVRAAATAAGVDAMALGDAFRQALPDYKPGVTMRAVDAREVIASALEGLGRADTDGAIAASAASAFAAAALAVYRLYDDARAILASLRYRGFPIAVVTNSIFPGAEFARAAPQLGIAGYVDAFVSSVDAGFGKPHRAPYILAAERAGVAPAEALFIGDRLDTDIAGALGAGMQAVLIDRGGRSAADGNVAVITSLAALGPIIGERTAPH